MADPSYIPDPEDVELVAAHLRFEPMPQLAANNVLHALAAAGRLTPADAKTEWGWLSTDGATVYRSPSEELARAAASRSGARQLMRRGPWQPVRALADGLGIDLEGPR